MFEPHHCSARTCRKDQEKTSAAHCRQRKMKETTSSNISWPNATSRSCLFEGTVLERKRERVSERGREQGKRERRTRRRKVKKGERE